MMVKGVVDDVDVLIGMHLGFHTNRTGQLACQIDSFLATTKLDATFTGVAAHAGGAGSRTQCALGSCYCGAESSCASSSQSRPSRINVGQLEAGTGRNVVPPKAVLKLETRGTTSVINEFMFTESVRVIKVMPPICMA